VVEPGRGTHDGEINGCNSGTRLLSGGKGKYEDWGLRVAMALDDDNSASCPEPTITLSFSEDDDNDTTTIDFVYIPPGIFIMGGTSTTDGRFQCVEMPHHTVRITKGFYLGKYPVIQQQYQWMRKGKTPSKSTKQPESVRWIMSVWRMLFYFVTRLVS